uniref:ARAD1D47454p n=1 Tax=Blastobotrys adeninivorans TaxID=409370 RepID=A0A060TIL6_BLAAD
MSTTANGTKGTISPLTGLTYLESLKRDGYVRIPQVLSPEELETFRQAAQRTTKAAREGKWPYIRTIPKQFPPWGSDPSEGIWGVQHLMHPDLPDSPLFVAAYFNSKVRAVVKELLAEADPNGEPVKDEDLVMELYNMLVRPDKDFALRWHRDDVPPEATPEEEMKRLSEPGFHAQWNMPLYDDESLIVVTGSHARPRTDAERNADPFEDNMPNQDVVDMKAGDVIFYNNNIFHRGVYDSTKERMTLHGTMGHAKGAAHRARNVLQHGVREWIKDIRLDALNDEDRKVAEEMRARLIKLGSDNPNPGYSQTD